MSETTYSPGALIADAQDALARAGRTPRRDCPVAAVVAAAQLLRALGVDPAVPAEHEQAGNV